MTTLRVWMLGSFDVELHGTRLTDRQWRSRQVRTILKYLLSRRDHVVTVDQLIELLWPEEDPVAARRRVYVRTSQLRRLLNPDDATQFILTVDGGYRIAPDAPLWLDVAAFEAALGEGYAAQDDGDMPRATASFERARDLYRGDFLEEDLYEGWTTMERERLREQYLTLLLENAECYARQGQYRRALDSCRQLLVTDPVREAVYVRMMHYHYHAGERDQALRAYQRCRQVLAEQLGVEPLPETSALARQIENNEPGRAAGATVYPPPQHEQGLLALPYSLGHPPFVGRAGPYRALVDALRNVESTDVGSTGLLITLTGPTGGGKSRLVQEAVAALGDGAQILTARGCDPADAAPYQSILELLQPLTAADGGITLTWQEDAPSGSPRAFTDKGTAHRRHLVDSVTALLRRAAQQRPLILVLDDAHRLDSASILLCEDLLDRAAGLPIAWLLIYRDAGGGHGSPPPSRPQSASTITLTLPPLTAEESNGLLDAVTNPGALPAEVRGRIVDGCGGNPLHLLSTVQNLFEAGHLRLNEAGVWQIGNAESAWTLPTSLRHTLQQRIDRLDDEERRLLEIIAVFGRPVDTLLLERATGWNRAVLHPAVDTLRRGRLVTTAGTPGNAGYDVDHDQLRTIVVDGLSAERRQQIHRRVAEALQIDRGSDPAAAAALARHYHAGGLVSTGVKYALRAGEHALRLYANRQALEHFARAQSWAAAAGLVLERREQAALHFHQAVALRRRGEHGEAQELLQIALPLAQGELKQVIYYTLCSVQAQTGGNLARINHVDSELERELVQLGDSWALAFMWWNQSFWFGLRGQQSEARRRAAAGWRVARRLQERGDRPRPMALATAHLGQARMQRWWSQWRRSLWHGRRALALSSTPEDRNGLANAHAAVGAALCGLGRWSDAEDHLDRCFEIAAAARDPRLQAEAHYRRGVIALLRGDLPTAENYADRTLSAAGGIGDVLRLAQGQQLQARIALARGRSDDALPPLQRQRQVARAVDAAVIAVQMTRYLVDALWQSGDVEEAARLAAAGSDDARTTGQRRELSAFLGVLARVAAARGDLKRAAARAAEAEQVALGTWAPFDVAAARRVRGEIALARGDTAAARLFLNEAAESFAALGAAGEERATRALPNVHRPVPHEP